MDKEVIKRLRGAGLLSELSVDLGFVGTGSYALNKIVSGGYNKGIPLGMITQFIGESSTAKTVFGTHILREAQSKNYYSMMVDSENAYNPEFASHLGIDPKKLIYAAPETLEDCFQVIEDTILEIRKTDKETPIVVVYDSLAVSPSKSEYEAEGYEGNNMQGAVRAKSTGACLRKINPLMRKHKVALVIINQIRNKVGVMYGSPDTAAAGGKSLEYYLGVNLKCISNKTSDLIKDEAKNVISFDDGLNPYAGVLKQMEADQHVERNGAWYTVKATGKKFQAKEFVELLPTPEFTPLRELLK